MGLLTESYCPDCGRIMADRYTRNRHDVCFGNCDESLKKFNLMLEKIRESVRRGKQLSPGALGVKVGE